MPVVCQVTYLCHLAFPFHLLPRVKPPTLNEKRAYLSPSLYPFASLILTKHATTYLYLSTKRNGTSYL